MLLYEIIDDTTKKEVETMKFMAELPRSKQQDAVDAESLFTLLEDEQMLAFDDVSTLEDMLTQIHRHDLLDKLHIYKSR